MNRGDVWWVETPNGGRRPYMILSRQSAIGVMDRVLAVPATRTVRGAPSELTLDEDDGMPWACVLSFDNLTHKRKSMFVEYICALKGERLDEACKVLALATGC